MITNPQTKNNLLNFSRELQVVMHPSDPRAPKDKLFDLGLVISAPGSAVTGDDVYSTFPNGTAYHFLLNNSNDYLLFAKAFFIANSEGRDLIVTCAADPSSNVISALKQLSEGNVFIMPNFNKQELFSMPLNPKTRVIFCINEDFLNEKITYPYFINLFGSVLRIK